MKRSISKSSLVATVICLSLAWTAPVFAELEEIIVTAQKRAQDLQDVPIAITAFDAEALENYRIAGPEDLGKITPGVYVTQTPADTNGVRVNIRGIGTLDPQVGIDSRVAIYQDGVYLGKSQGLAFDMPDLERVEILKGPQGTLYGRNTVAGAVNLISARPDPEGNSGKVKAEIGNFGHTKLSGSGNFAISDNTAIRVSGSWLERDGWVENDGPGTDFGGEEKQGFRIALGSEISDSFRFDLAADYSEIDREPVFYQSVGNGITPQGGNALFAPAITPFNNGRQENVTTSFENGSSVTESQGITAIGTWSFNDTNELKITAAFREIDSDRFAALIPTTNPAILNAISGGFNPALAPLPFAFGAAGQQLRPDFAAAFSGMEPELGLFLSDPPNGVPTLDGHEQTSLDITYTGESASGKWSYTGGIFYFDEDTGKEDGNLAPTTNANDYLFVLGQFDPRLTAPNIAGFLTGFGVPAANTGPIPASLALLNFLQNPATAAQAAPLLQQIVGNGSTCGAGDVPMPANNFCIPTLSAALGSVRAGTNGDLRIDTQALGIYGEATLNVSDTFRATFGLRYSDESKDGVGQPRVPFFNDTTTLTGLPIAQNVDTWEDDSLDPSLTLEWDASEDVLLYASYKESYRAGGFNATAVALPLPGETSGVDFIFEKEEITAFEIGMKGDFGGAFRLNAAAYWYDFTNKQTTVATSQILATERAIVNVDDEIYGLDVDALIAFSPNWTVNASLNYTDGDAGIPVNPVTGVQSTRAPGLQGVPELSYTLGLNYNGEWGANDLFGSLVFSHSDEILSVPESFLFLSDRDVLNGNIGMGFNLAGGNRATVSLWAQNLTDEEYRIESLPFNTFAFDVEVFAQPRSYGLSVGLDF